MTTVTASRIAVTINRLGILERRVDQYAVRESWRCVIDGEADLLNPLDALLWKWRYELVRGGNIGRVDQWVTLYGRRPKGLRRAA